MHQANASVLPDPAPTPQSLIQRRGSQEIAARLVWMASIFLCLVMSACTSEPEKPNTPTRPVERFITNITPEGTKRFVYDLAMQSPKRGSGSDSGHSGGGHGGMGGGRGGMGGGHGGGHRQDGSSEQGTDTGQTQMESKVRDRMDVKLKETGFCTAGYDELSKTFDEGHFQIAGQCKDQATPQDRARFPNASAGG